jgi:hypothetical protein
MSAMKSTEGIDSTVSLPSLNPRSLVGQLEFVKNHHQSRHWDVLCKRRILTGQPFEV